MHLLIRFSQFFISPLVKIEAMEREVLAVDSGGFLLVNFVAFSFFFRRKYMGCLETVLENAFLFVKKKIQCKHVHLTSS